jgi:predicted RNase H-like HicB family nuclease
MKYPVAIEPAGPDTAWGVVVPDLPGCFSAADDSIDAALDNTKEAIELWIEAALDEGRSIPKPSSIEKLRADPGYEGWIWAIVEIDPVVLDDTVERVNISVPRRVLHILDAKAKQAGESRSAFIAHLAMTA